MFTFRILFYAFDIADQQDTLSREYPYQLRNKITYREAFINVMQSIAVRTVTWSYQIKS